MTRPKISHRDEADHWYHVKLTPEVAEREKRHEKVVANALLAIHDDVRRIADALTRDHLHRLLAEESAAERRDDAADTAPDVDPDEALRGAVVSLTRRLHDVDARAKQAEADVERLTRERDEAQERHKALRASVERLRRLGLRRLYGTLTRTYDVSVALDLSRALDRDDERAK